MGRYLGIGIVTEVSTNKDEAIKALSGEDAAKDYLNRRYNHTGLYDFIDNGCYNFTLKRDIVRREWIDVLKTFYPMRYPGWKDDTNVIGSLQALDDPKKWLAKETASGHHTQYAKLFYYDVTCHDFGRRITSQVDMICLSLDGKILMETYDGVMEFFTSLVRERLAGFQLRDAFKVNLVG